jgi:hypothetical protein
MGVDLAPISKSIETQLSWSVSPFSDLSFSPKIGTVILQEKML